MVRRIVGSVVDYAKGNLSENDIASALNGELRINANPFPPDYLILYNIETGSEMSYDDYVLRTLKRRFNELLIDFTARRILEKESLEYMKQTEKLINRD